MTIKDVEKLTGLTAKSIRYYESKNLIIVTRNKENSYRNYTEADVNRLRWIKLFRYLEFSIEEIEKLLDMDTGEMKEALRQKADIFSRQKDLCGDKQELCLSLAKDYGNSPEVVEEYNDTIEFLESDEMCELMEQLEDANAPDLTTTIIQTLIFMAPVFWLFFNIKAERIGMLMVNGVVAVVGSSATTWIWLRYVNEYQKHKMRVKKKNRKMVWSIPTIIMAIVLVFAVMIALTTLVEKYVIPKEFLFYEYNPVAELMLIWLIMMPVILLCLTIVAKISKDNDILFLGSILGKWRPIAVVVWSIALYCCMMSFNVVTSDKIICYSPLNPRGIEYNYSDVNLIKTGFGKRNFALLEYKKKGSFYYQIELDEKTIIFQIPSINEEIERYEEDSYLELEEFDQALVALGTLKEADKEGWENCDFDEEYVNRFLRIVELK